MLQRRKMGEGRRGLSLRRNYCPGEPERGVERHFKNVA